MANGEQIYATMEREDYMRIIGLIEHLNML